MKTLRLDLAHPKAYILAKCLIGSEVLVDPNMLENSSIQLLGVTKGGAMVNPHNDYYCSLWQLVELDAHKLTICPWLCAKYQIPLTKGSAKGIPQFNGRDFWIAFEKCTFGNDFSLDFEIIGTWEGVTVLEFGNSSNGPTK